MTTTPPRRRWFQFGIGTILLAFLLVALCLALVKEHRRRVRAEATIDAIEQALADGESPRRRTRASLSSQAQVRRAFGLMWPSRNTDWGMNPDRI